MVISLACSFGSGNQVSSSPNQPNSETPTIVASPTIDANPTPKPTDIPKLSQDELIEKYRAVFGSNTMLYGICVTTLGSIDKDVDGEIGESELLGEVLAAQIFLGAADSAITDWVPPDDLLSSKDEIVASAQALSDLISKWSNDEVTPADAKVDVEKVCQMIENRAKELVEDAKADGLTEDSLDQIGEDVMASIAEVQSTLPTPVAETKDVTALNTLTEIGFSRNNPFPLGQSGEAPNWNVTIIEVVRGDEAWQMIQAANQFNDTPVEGTEYVLIKVKAVSTAQDEEEHTIGSWDFDITGSKLIQYSTAPVVVPEPGLDASLYSGGETEGWLVFQVGVDETNLILLLDELASWDEDRYRFYAVEEGAKVTIPEELAQITSTDLGISRSAPAQFGETAMTEEWEVTVKEIIRGADAFAKLQEANQFNDPPAEGMEYVLVKVHVRFIGLSNTSTSIDSFSFKSTGSASTLYDTSTIVAPDPALSAYLYPGGEYEGWVPLTIGTGETGIILVFQPWSDWDDTNRRFMSLEQ